MTDLKTDDLTDYYRDAASWSDDSAREIANSRKLAWTVAAVAGGIALLEGIALVLLTPLKTVEPYTLLVDRQTGYVQAVKPLERETIAPDTALIRSFLVQYVIARESFDVDTIKDSYTKVALWSAGDARSRYVADSQASNPASPLATLPRRALVEVQVRSVSSVNADTSLVRFTTTRTDPGAQAQVPQYWAAMIKYRFSGAAMTAQDRLINPLGFQVLRYRRDAEVLPETGPVVPAVVRAPLAPAPAAVPQVTR